MKRILSMFLIISLCSIYISPAVHAENKLISVPGFATLEIPKQIKLSKSKCQNIPVVYEINEELELEGAALLIQVGYISKKKQAGFAAWFGNISDSGAMAMPLIGQLKLKVCQKNWTLREQKFIAVKPGTYDVYIAYGFYQIDGTTRKEVITEKIKFTK